MASLGAPFTADSLEFEKLRPELKQNLRDAESDFRKALSDMLEVFPAHLIGSDMRSLVVDVPARFIKGLLPVLKELSATKDQVQILEALLVANHAAPQSRHG